MKWLVDVHAGVHLSLPAVHQKVFQILDEITVIACFKTNEEYYK